jgi:hypothetical protein
VQDWRCFLIDGCTIRRLWLAAAADGVGYASTGTIVLHRSAAVTFMFSATICVQLLEPQRLRLLDDGLERAAVTCLAAGRGRIVDGEGRVVGAVDKPETRGNIALPAQTQQVLG